MVVKKSDPSYLPVVNITLFSIAFVILLFTLSPQYRALKQNFINPTPTPTPTRLFPTPIPISSPRPTNPAQVPDGYTCPQTKYHDCMPIIREDLQYLCTPDYLDWISKNCPGVQVLH